MWNSLDLKCPSEDLSKYPPQDQYLAESLRDFVTVLTTAANTLTSENPLWSELQVLQNIQRKYKRILHCDRCLAFIHRVGTCTKKMVLLNLSKSYLDLAEKFLIGMQDPSMTYHLPSRQQLEYVLIRTVTASKLVCQSIKYSRETFCYLIRKLKIGHLILDLVMAASVIARLNILLRATLEQLCSMYQQILLWRYKLKAGTFQWPQKPDFPQNLKPWLKISEAGCLDPFPMSKADVDVLSDLLKPTNGTKDSDASDAESVVLVAEVNQEESSVENPNKRNAIDCGEVIPRKKRKMTHPLKPEQKLLLQNILQVQSLKDLEKLWNEVRSYPSNHFPRVLTELKKKHINRLFIQIKNTVSEKKFNKVFKNEPAFLKTAHSVFGKHLGFTVADIVVCRNEISVTKTSGVSNASETTWVSNTSSVANASETACVSNTSKTSEDGETPLAPVKTFKKLKCLYNRLCEILKFTEETKKHQKLQKYFKRRKVDIKLLKQNGETETVRKLIFCTSKILLTMCQS